MVVRLGGAEHGLEFGHQQLTQQPVARAEPAVDRRSAEAQLGGDRPNVDPLPGNG